MRRLPLLPWLLTALLLVPACGGDESSDSGPADDSGKNPPATGTSAPEVKAVTLDGLMDITEPEEPRTKPVVINVWAAWCDECPAEIPYLKALRKKLGDRADLVSISMDFADNRAKYPDAAAAVAAVRVAAKKLGIDYPVLVADPGDGDPLGWYQYLDIESEVPYTVVIDADGENRGSHAAFTSADEAMTWFEGCLAGD